MHCASPNYEEIFLRPSLIHTVLNTATQPPTRGALDFESSHCAHYITVSEIKDGEMGRPYSKHGKNKKYTQKLHWKS
jgi:hypothetical protein